MDFLFLDDDQHNLRALLYAGDKASVELAFEIAHANKINLNVSDYENLHDWLLARYMVQDCQDYSSMIVQLAQITTLTIHSLRAPRLLKEIGLLCNLRTFSSAHTQLKSLPEEIGNWINLEELHLTGNQIRQLPDSFSRLKNLRFLNLNSNPIETLPENIGELYKLKTLYLHKTRITDLPKSIGQLQNLENICLPYKNNFPRKALQKIKKLLPNCKVHRLYY